jgi:3,5-epimerase/4-reductase
MSEILIFGDGLIGSKLGPVLKATKALSTISTYEEIQQAIDVHKPKVLVNCIDIDSPTVDDCEKDLNKSLHILTKIPLLMCEAAIRNRIKLVHISSGCIFNYDYRDLPLSETYRPDFFDLYYSRLKVYAEAALDAVSAAANILQLRIRMPLDCEPHPQELLTKLLTYKTIVDIPNSVTYIPDFVMAARHLINQDAEGIYNCVNYGGLKNRELLEEFRKYFPTHSYSIIDPAELKKVRTNVILSTDKLEEAGFQVRDIHDILKECVEKYVSCLKT